MQVLPEFVYYLQGIVFMFIFRYNPSRMQVTEFVYLGYRELHTHALFHIVGRHMAYLNNVHERWHSAQKAGESFDLIEFLSDSWTSAFFHDEFFEKFIKDLKGEEDIKEKIKTQTNLDSAVQEKLLAYLKLCQAIATSSITFSSTFLMMPILIVLVLKRLILKEI